MNTVQKSRRKHWDGEGSRNLTLVFMLINILDSRSPWAKNTVLSQTIIASNTSLRVTSEIKMYAGTFKLVEIHRLKDYDGRGVLVRIRRLVRTCACDSVNNPLGAISSVPKNLIPEQKLFVSCL